MKHCFIFLYCFISYEQHLIRRYSFKNLIVTIDVLSLPCLSLISHFYKGPKVSVRSDPGDFTKGPVKVRSGTGPHIRGPVQP